MKIVVIGGGAAGMMFSTQYKKANPNDDVFVFEKSKYVSWAGCPTPYYIADELPFSKVVLSKAEDFIQKGIQVKIEHEVLSIDTTNKHLHIKGNEIDGVFGYDKLIIAVGGTSFIPNIIGYQKDIKNIFALSHATDAEKIKNYLTYNTPKKAVIIGSGFIGLEMAESFNKNGLDVTIIEKESLIFPSITQKLLQPIYQKLSETNITLSMNSEVTEIISENHIGNHIKLKNGDLIPFDIALFSIGITPNIDFLIQNNTQKFDLENRKLLVNDTFETNIADVYAIGDCILNKYHNTQEYIYTPFGDVANKHGIILSKYLSGQKDIKWHGLLKSFATSFYDIKLAKTGLTYEEAEKRGFQPKKIYMTAFTKNSGFSDSQTNEVEIVYDTNKKILLGATIIGYEAVAQFIDQIAIVITFEIPIEKFIDIDFAYSPTNASVWNPLLVTYRKVIK